MKQFNAIENKELEVIEIFHGDKHTNFDNAYLIEDYPYGFTLRTQKKIWIETKNKHGQRIAECTLNPKTGNWNKPKFSTYRDIILLCQLENSHISHFNLTVYSWPKEIVEFWKLTPYMSHEQKTMYNLLETISRKLNPNSWTRYYNSIIYNQHMEE